jgi:hypothetical protein
LVRERERASLAADQLEKSRRHADLATVQFREGKDPLTEVPELRVGPLRELLEAARRISALPERSATATAPKTAATTAAAKPMAPGRKCPTSPATRAAMNAAIENGGAEAAGAGREAGTCGAASCRDVTRGVGAADDSSRGAGF